MELTVVPGKSLFGEIELGGDKSLSHRLAILGSISEGECRIGNFLVAGVTKPLLKGLSQLGVAWRLNKNDLVILGNGFDGLVSPTEVIDCGNSATTMRLLAGLAAAAGINCILDGSASLRRRPMKRIIEPLRLMGVDISGPANCAPLVIHKRLSPLVPIEYELPVPSAQVKSTILISALSAPGTSILREPGPSRDHTERIFLALGLNISSSLWDRTEKDIPTGDLLINETRMTVPPGFKIRPFDNSLPGDISSAAFLIIACLITPGSEILLRNIGINPTRTGLIDVLIEMGADITVIAKGAMAGEPVGDILIKSSKLHGCVVSGSLVVRMIDEFPALAAAAAFADGETIVMGAEELRHKESDRIREMSDQLCKLGVNIHETPDGFHVKSGKLPLGGNVNAGNDHRLAMALALVGLAASGPVNISGAEIHQESFPNFVQVLQSLGANLSPGA